MQRCKRYLPFLTLIFLLVGNGILPGQGRGKPNIIVILADDLGYGDTQPYNALSSIETPHFNQLAKDGIRFTDAHSGSGVCTPTRYGLLCGRYCWRTQLKRGVLGGYSKPLIAIEQQTFPQRLQQAGYHTHVIGKWHLGLGWQWNEQPENINQFGQAGKPNSVNFSKPITDGPLEHGFNSCYLFPASLDMSPYVFIKDRNVETPPTTSLNASKFPAFYRKGETFEGFNVEDVLGMLTAKAKGYIEERSKAENPFCLYFPLTAPHKPVSPGKDFQGNTQLGPYGDFVTEVDWVIGEIVATLNETGTANNTLLIVTSDNGSFMHRLPSGEADHTTQSTIQGFADSNHTSNGELKGTKADVYEAGHRVPFYVRWPEGIPKSLWGTETDQTICHTDILATVCDVANVDFDREQSPDSFSFAELIQGTTNTVDRAPVINHSAAGMFAIRKGKYKLILGNGSGGRMKPKGKPFEHPYQLFDLTADLSETNNLATEHQDLVTEMIDQFEEIANGDQHPTKK